MKSSISDSHLLQSLQNIQIHDDLISGYIFVINFDTSDAERLEEGIVIERCWRQESSI